MGRVVAVERLPHLSGTLVAGNVLVADDARTVEDGAVSLADLALAAEVPALTGTLTADELVRADGAGSVQGGAAGAKWYLDDTGLLRAPLAVDGTPIYSALRFEPSAGKYGTIGATSTDTAFRLTTSAADVPMVLDAAGELSLEFDTFDLRDGGRSYLTINVANHLELSGEAVTVTDGVSSVALDSNGVTVTPGANRRFRVASGGLGWTVEGVAYSAAQIVDLFAIAGLAVTDGNFIVGNGSTWVAESTSDARASLGFLAAFPWAGDVVITDTNLTDVFVSALSIGPSQRYAIVGSMTVSSPSVDDIQLQWTTTGSTTCTIGHVTPSGSMSGLAENTLSGLIATTGATQRITFFGTVDGGASGGTIKLQVRKNADSAGTDTTVYSSGTGFSLTPIA